MKIQTPRSKIQRNSNNQAPTPAPRRPIFRIGSWFFSGSWILVFGAFPCFMFAAFSSFVFGAYSCFAQTVLPKPEEIPPLRPPQGEIPPTFWEQHGLLVVLLSLLLLAI